MCSNVVLGKNILLNCVGLRHKLSVLNYELGIRDLVIPLIKKKLEDLLSIRLKVAYSVIFFVKNFGLHNYSTERHSSMSCFNLNHWSVPNQHKSVLLIKKI